jgi:hypothetical protein
LSEEEARIRALSILLLLATDWGLDEWLNRFDDEALGALKRAVIEILRCDITG